MKRCVLFVCAAGLGCQAQTGPAVENKPEPVVLPSPVPLPGGKAILASYHFRVLTRTTLDDTIIPLQLAPHIATSVRLPEPVNSVVVGSPECFAVEHSEGESQLVTIRPKKEEACESNLQITTVSGKHALLDLHNLGVVSRGDQVIDVLLEYTIRTPGSFFENHPASSLFVAETRSLDAAPTVSATKQRPTISSTLLGATGETDSSTTPLDTLLKQQQQAALPILYGQKPGEIPAGKRVRAGVSNVIDNGAQVIVLFSAINPAQHAIEILPPQVQLGGKIKNKWTLGEQLPVTAYRLSTRRLGPHERMDGVALFERPAFKQSNETLFLQIAESGAVDKPALAPIGFGISTIEGGYSGAP